MVVEPDCHLVPRPNRHDKVKKILARNGRVHFNLNMRFNANSLGVLFTEKLAIGIALIPNVVFKDRDGRYDFAWTLWGNSTLGLLLQWAHSGKQQPGRGMNGRKGLLQMPTLDVRCLSDEALANAERVFHTLKHQRMLPFNEVDHDPVRHELDRLLLSEVLNITNMDEFKSPQKNDNLKQLFDNYAEIVGGGIGAVLGFLAGDPIAAAFSGAGGAAAASILRTIGQEFSERQLSARENFRVGKVLAIAAWEIHRRLEKGESLRTDGFFDKKPTGRSEAEEVAEAIMLKCQREPQEKKIQYMGYLKASIAFENVSADMGHQLIKAAEELTYRQFCILKLSVVKDRFDLRNQDYQNHEKFSKELYQVLQECHDLCLKNYLDYKIPLTHSGEIAVSYMNMRPNDMTIQRIGEDLFKLMKLSSIPDEDIIPIAKVLK